MNCLYIIAANDGDFCGVYDYTKKLADSLNLLGLNTQVLSIDSWSVKSLLVIRKTLIKTNFDVVHVQYPSLRMGNSFSFALLPLILPRKSKLFLTLHEFSVFNLLRKLYCLTYNLFAKNIIFSNNWEAQEFKNFYLKNRNLAVLPIGANIYPSHQLPDNATRKFFLVYFGQIVKGKGLSEFLDTISILRSQNFNAQALIMGASKKGDLFLNEIIARSEKLNIEVKLNLSETEISECLSNSKFALLPFPDGLSEKRGSALAALLHGVYLISKFTEKTPEWLKSVSIPFKNADDTASSIIANNLPLPEPNVVIKKVNDQCSWQSIAKKHIELYLS